ncbi:hypothetical protein D3C87_1753650 [compost metagenome]
MQDIADRGKEQRLRAHRLDRIEKRQKLETHLPAAERKGFGDDNIRLGVAKNRQQLLHALALSVRPERCSIYVLQA